MQRFAGRVVLITGGAAGIGRATARRVTAEAGRVVLLDWSGDDLAAALAELEGAGAGCAGLRGDAARMEDCEAAVRLAIERWGRLDALVANAGVRAFGSLLEATDADWERILAVNLRGVANGCVAAARAMRAGGRGGSMVLVSSQNALVGR
jgi:NAD(P)-dependent dehydrogenase (short-subunit alcohol dehydrogenase family)